jgi:hypothetical protein
MVVAEDQASRFVVRLHHRTWWLSCSLVSRVTERQRAEGSEPSTWFTFQGVR